MASVLGKRKLAAPAAAHAAAARPSTADSDADVIQDVFRRHFEAQFRPLKTRPAKPKASEGKPAAAPAAESDGSSEDSDWSGLDDDDDESTAAESVQVIDYSKSAADDADTAAMTKQERKAYLSSRPLAAWDDDDTKRPPKTTAASSAASDVQDAPDLLANDLALQRLLAESHLLAGGRAAPALSALANPLKSQRPFAAGRLRQRAADLRVQAAAAAVRGPHGPQSLPGAIPPRARDSIFTQTAMPMAIRKGIAAAAAARETRRRREARESGIVLERPSAAASAAKDKRRRRLRAIDAPAVGRLHGSELRLRDRDVRAIQGPRSGPGQKKRKRR